MTLLSVPKSTERVPLATLPDAINIDAEGAAGDRDGKWNAFVKKLPALNLKLVSPPPVSFAAVQLFPCMLVPWHDFDEISAVFELFHGRELAVAPEPINSTGMNFSYFIRLKEKEKIVSVFKPDDGAIGACNAPHRSRFMTASKRSIPPEQQTWREVIGYSLGREVLGVKLVPPTGMVTLKHRAFCELGSADDALKTKSGSFQLYIPNTKPLVSLDQAQLKKAIHISLERFQALAVLDIRGVNTDRTMGNLLVQVDESGAVQMGAEGFATLIPIDHGCILPRGFGDSVRVIWISWKIAQAPFSAKAKEAIMKIDMETDQTYMASDFPDLDQESIDTARYATMLLKKGATVGLTPFQIVNFLTCENAFAVSSESAMYFLYKKAKVLVPEGPARKLDAAMSHLIDQLIALLRSYDGPGDRISNFLIDRAKKF